MIEMPEMYELYVYLVFHYTELKYHISYFFYFFFVLPPSSFASLLNFTKVTLWQEWLLISDDQNLVVR